MDKLLESNPTDFSIYSEDAHGKTYKFPKKLITIRSRQTTRTLTEDQKEELRERMKGIRTKTSDSDTE